MRSIEEDSLEPFACKMETEIDTSFEESIAKIISSLEEDNDDSSTTLQTGFDSGCGIIKNLPTSMAKIKEEIFENIFAEYKTKILEEEKFQNNFNSSKMINSEDKFDLKSQIELEQPKLSPTSNLKNISLWDEFEVKLGLNLYSRYIKSCLVNLVKLPKSFKAFYKEIPLTSLNKIGSKRKKTSKTNLEQNKKIKLEVETKVVPTSNRNVKSKSRRRKTEKKNNSRVKNQDQEASTEAPCATPAKKLSVQKIEPSNNIKLEPKLVVVKQAKSPTKLPKTVAKLVKLENKSSNTTRSNKKALAKNDSIIAIKTGRKTVSKILKKEMKMEILPQDNFPIETRIESKNSTKISYENFIPALSLKESKLNEDGVEKFLRKRYIIISSMPLVPHKSILSINKEPKKSLKKVSFCSSIFIRRFVPDENEDLELS